jgi:predicted DNA-binding transcriptional regulator AlpA
MDITLLTEREVADFAGKSIQTWRRYRAQGRAPEAVKIGRSIMYTREAVSRWLIANQLRPGG